MTKLPEYDQFQAPWEKAGEEVDAEKAKKFLYSLLQQNQTLEGKVATVTAERDTVKSDLTKVQAKVEEFETKDLSEVDKLKAENEKLRTAKPEGDPLEAARLRAAFAAELDLEWADRLKGNTAEELEADAKKLAESWGGRGKPADDDGDADSIRRQPAVLRNPADPDPSGGTPFEATPDAVAAIPRI